MSATDDSELSSTAVEKLEAFTFTGAGGEFFRIWIVNLFLTIITLGIYSAWAKVRTHSYFYGNTHLQDNSFRYLASPITILKGRLVAVAFVLLYSYINNTYPLAGALLSLLLLAVLPWLIVRSVRFHAINSAYRNVRFDFRGRPGGAAIAFLLWPTLGLLSLGLLFPLAIKKQQEFLVRNYRFGTSEFGFDAPTRPFYAAFFGAVGLLFLFTLAAFSAGMLGKVAMGLVILVAYLTSFAFFRARMFNLVYSGASLGSHGFEADMTPSGYLQVIAANVLLMVLTLGLFYPFARVRLAHYTAQHLRAKICGSLDDFVAAEGEKVSALGDELAEFMDLDIGL
jgi:uncharacterized membrane protein YjgN (DUF898 family)